MDEKNQGGALITRRGFVGASLVCGVLACCGGLLAGCESGQTAKRFSMLPALSGDGFEMAKQAVAGEASDAVLIAARLTKPLAPEAPADDAAWMYLFASKGSSMSYTVFPGDEQPLAAAFEPYALTEAQWASVPPVEQVALDADAAYGKLADLYAEELSDKDDCLVYLMTYVAEDEDPLADAMKWFFEFGKSAEGEAGADGGDDADSAGGEQGSGTTEGEGESGADEGGAGSGSDDDAPTLQIVTYCVDAVTGEVSKIET